MTNLPVTGDFTITAVYGQKGSHWANGHQGIDFVAADRRIFATCTGKVRRVAYDPGGWGWYVSIGDEEGRRHIFCHLKAGSIEVVPGETVNRNTVIGIMGATGNVTGVHLHYQLQMGETVIDPTDWLGIPNRVGGYNSEDYQIEEVSKMDFKDKAEIPAWAKAAVEEAAADGLMLGDGDGNFRPNDPITRAEFAVVLQRLRNL